MRVGIGYQNTEDSVGAGRDIAREAISKADISAPDYVIAFCANTVDAGQFLAGLQSVVGQNVPVIGGSAIGVITNDVICCAGRPAGAAVVQTDRIDFKVAFADQLHENPLETGQRLLSNLSPRDRDRLLLVFYDSIRRPAAPSRPPVLNPSGPLIEGLSMHKGGDWMVLGAGLVGDYQFGPTIQFCLDRVRSQSAVGLMLSGPFCPYFSIFHGCTPLDGCYHTITSMEDDEIYEIDHEPVVDVIDRAYGNQIWRGQRPVNLLTLGVNCGEKFDTPQESNYINRLITGVLPDNRGIGLFEPDLHEGAEIQFMLRDPVKMIESAQCNSVRLLEKIYSDDRKPVCGIYFDCAGRSASSSSTPVEEAALVQEALNSHQIPLLGFYSGVEIAPLMGKSRGLDWTGVLVVIAED